MKTFVLKACIFFCLLMLCLTALDRLVPYYWGAPQLAKKMAALRRRWDGVDTLFIGSSRMYRGVDPAVFDRRANPPTRSFNLGAGAMCGLEAMAFYGRLLDSPPPPGLKCVFLEMQNVAHILDRNLHTVRVKYYLGWEDYAFALRYFSSAPWVPREARNHILRNYTVAYRDELLKVGMVGPLLGFFLRPPAPDARARGPAGDGFFSLDAELGAGSKRGTFIRRYPAVLGQRREAARRAYGAGRGEPNRFLLRRIADLIERSRRRGIRLVFVLLPLQLNWSDLRPTLYALPPEHRIDLGNPFENPEFYTIEYCYDQNHVNDRGARLLTERLADRSNRLLEIERGAGGAPPAPGGR